MEYFKIYHRLYGHLKEDFSDLYEIVKRYEK